MSKWFDNTTRLNVASLSDKSKCVAKCFSLFAFWLNPLPQISQYESRTPVCVLKCLIKSVLCIHFLLHR